MSIIIEIMFHISLKIQIVSSCAREIYCSCHSKIKFISSCHAAISSIQSGGIDCLNNLTFVFFAPYHMGSFFQVWSLESGDCQLTLPGDHSSGVSSVTFNDQWVISGDNSGEIKVLYIKLTR